MKIVLAPDSFKESLSAARVCRAMERGLRRVLGSMEIVSVPMADGGEGTVDALVQATGGELRETDAHDPLDRPIAARYGILPDGRGAVVEMAAAGGLDLLSTQERNPLRTTTRGTGELIHAALDAGARRIIVGIGGSATVDCGTGMAAELGVRFRDAHRRPIERPCGGALERMAEIDVSGLDERLSGTEIIVASDVTNPLTGPDGAARVYAPQKGADPDAVRRLEAGIEHFAELVQEQLGTDLREVPGAGAAGGLGAGLVAFLGAEIRSGIVTVMETARLRERMRGAVLVLSGEGRLDRQSAFGKVPAGVAELAAELDVPAVVLAGALGQGWEAIYDSGACAVYSICDRPMTAEEAFRRAPELIENAAESVLRLWLTGHRAEHNQQTNRCQNEN